ncbi:Tetratricopeptide repeat-containing protein [Lishizhenia tianjinensis]|uniref:Tetratricopeptide repeat-containing protein n=1 Tax=Lishizhenia tianjinensis TaxID=477690 RepID=A0A1I6XYP5_9FLAO|nr:tetratricopeptide repeat protein [Lishizhenia tianjinensis]SFT43152.1 Tetratricopeptide repeat-containing protein [Lishizhenia tianjinensis]
MDENLNTEELIDQLKGNKVLKGFTIAVGVIVVIVLGIFGYNKLIVEPGEAEASDYNSTAISLLQKDSVNLAIAEFENQVADYDGYNQGEMAQFQLASLYFDKGDYQRALEEVEGVELNDEFIATLAKGLEGDCNVELGNLEDGIAAYVTAAERRKNELTTPHFLFKAGKVCEELKDFEKATEIYQTIIDEYPAFASQNTVEKYKARASNSTAK